ncbi:MAG: repressor LexA [Lachnospiraceae bacterium]|nr:repressor LexA [Lachnospiraceae bacterium]
MRHKDPELMKQINAYIGEFYAESDRTPSTTEIARRFGIARSTSQDYLVEMNRRGMLSYAGGVLQVGQMDKIRNRRARVPLVGSVPCGELSFEEENVECVTSLPTEIFGDGQLYMLHASGDSMEDEGIEDGDLVVVRMDAEPRKGDLVIALDADRRNTLKKYGGTDKKERRAMLLYCNRRVYGDKVIYVDQLECQGVVSHVIKKK